MWDLVVRFGHWALVVCFAVAYLTEDDALKLHTLAGYLIVTVVLFRVVWGFIGPRHALFKDFVKGPGEILGYLGSLPSGKGKRFIGHNPAGGAMAVLLLLSLAATAYTGMATLAEEKNQGPLAPLYGPQASVSLTVVSPALADDDDHGDRHSRKKSRFEEPHEFFANLTLILIGFHLLGVVSSSVAHRENLVRAMITGRKRL